MTLAPSTGATTARAATASPESAAIKTTKPDINFKNAMFFYNILSNMESKVEANWDTIAQKSGYKNASSAKASFGQIKQKFAQFDNDSMPDIISPKAPAKGRAKKEKAEKAAGSGTNVNASKISKKRAPRKKGKAVKAEENNEDMAEAEVEASQAVDQNDVEGPSTEASEAADAVEASI